MRNLLSWFYWLERTYEKFSRFVALFAGLIVVAMMIILLREITGRNIGMPSPAPMEWVVILVIWVKLVPMAFSQMSGGMIRITFLIDRLPPKVKPWIELLDSSLIVIFSLLLLKATFDYFNARVGGGYFPATHFPVDIQKGMMPICALLLTGATVICFGRSLVNLIVKDKDLSVKTIKGEVDE